MTVKEFCKAMKKLIKHITNNEYRFVVYHENHEPYLIGYFTELKELESNFGDFELLSFIIKYPFYTLHIELFVEKKEEHNNE